LRGAIVIRKCTISDSSASIPVFRVGNSDIMSEKYSFDGLFFFVLTVE